MSDLALNGNGMDQNAVEMTTEPRTLDIEIEPPIELNGKTYSTLHLAEPTAKMVELAEQELSASMSVHALRKYQIALVAQGSQTPLPVIQRMRISQVREAADFLSAFIGGGPQTGEI
jgi:Phage tail assembly chaperone proteins, E, or 41 or 14